MARYGSLLKRIIAVLAFALLMPPGLAHAAPGDGPLPEPVGALAISPTLPLPDLGAAADLAFYGQIGTASLTFPVPPGLTPASLNVTAELPVNVRSGTVTVSQDDRVISRRDVPAEGPAPVVIPLAGVRVVDNAVTVLLRSYLLPMDGYCLDPTNPLRLTAATVSFAGVEQPPATVADFLPPVLRKLTIYVGTAPSPAESDAVVQLAAAVAAHYGAQDPQIEVAPLAPGTGPLPGTSQPLERHIVVSEGPENGVSLYQHGAVAALLIAGSASELSNQTRLLTSKVAQYALGSKAVAGPLKSTPQLPGNSTTIRKLGQPGVNATALNPQVGIVLDQSRLGRAARGMRVHLLGSYTPLPSAIGGQLLVTIAGQTIDRWPADAGGVIDRWVDVPDRLLKRYVNLAVQVNISGNTGRCGEFQPITLTIDGESVVESSSAKPPVPAGFQALPQALMPRVEVGIGSNIYADTVRAVAIMTGLQRLSALPIDTVVVPLQQAIDSAGPAVLISPDKWDHPEIKLPVTAPGTVPMTLDVFDDDRDPTTLTLDPAIMFGSLQYVYDGKRSLLVATSNGAADQLDNLLRWLSADQRRWSDIDGEAILSVSGRDPLIVPGPGADAMTSVAAAGGFPWWLWWFGGGVLAVIAVATAWVLLRARRRTSGG